MTHLCEKSVLRTLSLVPVEGGYFELRKDGQSDDSVSRTDPILPESKVANPRLSISRALGGRKLPPVRTKLYYSTTITSSAATAIGSTLGLAPQLFSEFSSFSALYNEMKVHGGTVHYCVTLSVATSSGGPYSVLCGLVGYNPLSTANGTFSGDLSLAQRSLFTLPEFTTQVVHPIVLSKSGFRSFTFVCPNGPQSADDISVATGTWTETVSGQNYGYLIFNCEAGGTSCVVKIRYIVELDISFRSRQ